jgi:hypothetical protein
MFGRFLKEAAQITGQAELVEVGDEFEKIGNRWQEVANVFRRASENDDPAVLLPKTTAPLLEIADLEQAAWEHLLDAVT